MPHECITIEPQDSVELRKQETGLKKLTPGEFIDRYNETSQLVGTHIMN